MKKPKVGEPFDISKFIPNRRLNQGDGFITRTVSRDSSLSMTTKLVFCELTAYCDEYLTGKLSPEKNGALLGMSGSAFYNSFMELFRAGYIDEPLWNEDDGTVCYTISDKAMGWDNE